MPEILKLTATTATVHAAVAWHAGRVDVLIADPAQAGEVAHHMTEIEALNRLVAGDEDAVRVCVADIDDRARAQNAKFQAERAAEREQARQRAEAAVPPVKSVTG